MDSHAIPDKLPSDVLNLQDGIWRSARVSKVSYPEHGNDKCLAVEDKSYWFTHRNDVILAAMRLFSPRGPVYDIGGGNGFVSLAMQNAGHDVVLVEPGSGAVNAKQRGVNTVVQATLQDAEFMPESIDAVGVFDVVEHVENDDAFLTNIHAILVPGGRVYCTVPAYHWLWSQEDVAAGHFRRYTSATLRAAFHRAGYEIDFVTALFSWLTMPIMLIRTLPYAFGSRPNSARPQAAHDAARSAHSLPSILAPVVRALHRWELTRISRGSAVPFGTSLLCVARRSGKA